MGSQFKEFDCVWCLFELHKLGSEFNGPLSKTVFSNAVIVYLGRKFARNLNLGLNADRCLSMAEVNLWRLLNLKNQFVSKDAALTFAHIATAQLCNHLHGDLLQAFGVF